MFWPILRKSFKWVFLGPLDLIFNLFCVLFANWWVIFLARPVVKGDWLYHEAKPQWQGLEEKLPNWLSWFETFDASLDAGWIGGYFAPKDKYSKDNMPSFWRRKYYQWRWLNRNSGYSFSYYPLGVPMDKSKWTIHKWVRNFGTDSDKGYQLWIASSPEGYWNINLQGKYGTYKLGWKAWNYWDRELGTWYKGNEPWGPDYRTSIVMSINPFNRKKIEKK